MKRLIIAGGAILAILGLLSGSGYYLTHEADWARVYYKRFKAANEYVFDEINPLFKQTDPAKLIRITSRDDADRVRRDLIETIWGSGGFPSQTQLQATTGEVPDRLKNIDGVATARRFKVPIDIGYTAYLYILEPTVRNGRLVIYQHGYAGTVEAIVPLFKPLIAAGYAVVASNYPGYGPNQFPRHSFERFGLYDLSHDRVLTVHPRPLRFYIEPIIATVNAFAGSEKYNRIDLLGFSAGGWAATLAAAVDTRIASTTTVAGGYPLYLRLSNFERESPPPQLFPPLLQAANYLEIYALAADGRALTQIFNRYDRCCYRNTLGRLYEPAVRETVARLGPGRFRVLIDESHADHKVSEWAVENIVEELATAAP